MGGRLPFRLVDMCETYRDAEESKIYQKWLEGGRVHDGIQEFLCYNTNDNDLDLDLNNCGRHLKEEL